jgi:hypothetical protein
MWKVLLDRPYLNINLKQHPSILRWLRISYKRPSNRMIPHLRITGSIQESYFLIILTIDSFCFFFCIHPKSTNKNNSRKNRMSWISKVS